MNQGLTYAVDMVLCIDATASMRPVIEEVKSRALRFPDDVIAAMARKDKHVTRLRIRVVAYRDIGADAEPFLVSEFLLLPDQRSEFEAFVQRIEAMGGGDEPESGLEAIAIALQSDWSTDTDKYRHAIVVWTDASAHQLEKHAASRPAQFASVIPKDFDDLTDMWEGGQRHPVRIRQEARRLVIFAPEAYPWSDVALNWEEAIMFPSRAGGGLSDFEYDEIIETLAASVG